MRTFYEEWQELEVKSVIGMTENMRESSGKSSEMAENMRENNKKTSNMRENNQKTAIWAENEIFRYCFRQQCNS